MKSFLKIAVGWTCWLALAQPGRAVEPDCEPHGLEASAVKERLKHWGGLSAFARWRLVSVELSACPQAGRLGGRIEIAPPEAWSAHGLAYRTWLDLSVDGASGEPVGKAPEAWRELAAGVKRICGAVERHEDVQRFIERFGVANAAIGPAGAPGRFRVELQAKPLPGPAGGRVPSLAYDESLPERICAYQIPHMDSLPVRRELLRMLEVLSLQHPNCRPDWIRAQRSSRPKAVGLAEPGPELVSWTFRFDLQGEGCPQGYAALLEPDGAVARVQDPAEQATAKGDGVVSP